MILNTLEALDGSLADVNVIGAGPAGPVTALELAQRGVAVTMLESGFGRRTPEDMRYT